MTRGRKINIGVQVLCYLLVAFAWWYGAKSYGPRPETGRPPQATKIEYSILRTGPLRVAKVLGRSPACWNVQPDIVFKIAHASFRAGIDPEMVAAIISVESGCNPTAISSKGAVGLMQIHVSSWKNSYGNFQNYNLFNIETNIQIGSKILGELVRQYGVEEALYHYNGQGEDARRYQKEVLRLFSIQHIQKR